MSPLFNQSDILAECGQQAFHRGRSYWKSGRVIDVEVSQDLPVLLVEARVRGSGGRSYRQSIEIYGFDSDDVDIIGECSCPVGFNCKHVAAVLLVLLNSDEGQAALPVHDPLDGWLAELKQAVEPAKKTCSPPTPARVNYSVLYLLGPDQHRGNHRLEVKSYKVRHLKKGGYGKPAPYSLERIRSYYVDRFIDAMDKEIARSLVADSTAYYDFNNVYPLDGEYGELAMKKLLNSGRCHWLYAYAPPLRLGPPRRLEFQWRPVEGGQQLRWIIDPPAGRVLSLEGLWYLDEESGMAGPLEHPGLTGDQVVALLDAPVVPEARLEALSRELLLEAPEYDLPTPVPVDIERIHITGEQPSLQLRLYSEEETSVSGQLSRGHYARLSFAYGPVTLEDFSEDGKARVVRQNRVYLIDRDLAAETGAIEQLRAMGLQPLLRSGAGEPLDWLFHDESAAQSASCWQQFMDRQLPELERQGWRLTIDDSFQLRFDEPDEWHAELDEEGPDWFSLSLGVELDGQRINLLPALVDLLSQAGDPQRLREYLQARSHLLVPAGDDHWVKLPSERLQPIFDTLVELYDHEPLDQEGNLALSRHQGVQLGDLLNDPNLRWRGAEELQRLEQRLRDFKGIAQVEPPQGFNAQLRPYQQQGLSWLQFLPEFEFNGILADDMGLGKTVQTLAHLLLEKQSGRMDRPCLVIAPTSLMGNWRRETERFAPRLRVLLLHGSDRHAHFDRIDDQDLVLTTYPLLRRDKQHLLERAFHYVVLDESQAIKNPKSQTAQVVFELNARHRLCLTGTPMENHLGELWSMFHFLMPGFLGNLERFNRLFRNPIERQSDEVRRQQLSQRLKPFMLRRSKEVVAAELPEKNEIIRTVTLQGKQRDLYETIRLAMDKKVRREIGRKGLARSHIMILDALLKLRQVCCDPRLLPMEQAQRVEQSAKLELLMQMLPEMVEEGRRILLFSQFTKMLGLIEAELDRRRIPYSKLTGQTRKRDLAIARFQEGEAPVFLISLKAGGVGLNLTAADTVIHYDPWWNPAVENQATDRAHRIGQDKAVFVYKLITEETVEDKIIAMQQKKQALADAIYSGKTKEAPGQFSAEELTDLLRPLGE